MFFGKLKYYKENVNKETEIDKLLKEHSKKIEDIERTSEENKEKIDELEKSLNEKIKDIKVAFDIKDTKRCKNEHPNK